VVSPEDADPRYDIYALGATLYYMLTAQKPFSGKTREEVLAAKKAGKYARVSTVMRDVPPAVEAIVDRMMARDPAKRPRTMAEVIAAIADTGLAHEKPSWIGPPHPRHARKRKPWRDRRRQLASQYTAVLVAFAMALAVATLVYKAIEGTNPPVGRTTSDQPSPAAPPLGPPAEAFIAKALNQLNQGALAGAQQVLEEGLRVHAGDERMRALGKEIAQGVVVLFERETKDGANSLLLLPAVDGLTMARGQHQYRFTVIPSAACFVYILEQDPRPEMFWIFPNESYAEDQNPLPPGMHRVPSADRWFPGDNAQGTERLYVIAVTRPLRDPEAVRQQLGSDPDGLRSRLEANLESFLEPGQGQGKSCFAAGSVWQSAAFSHV
jgi:hypothetical protein